MNLFTEFAFSDQGYNHIKVDKECQDASGFFSDDRMEIISVADGHGSDNYPRTAKGSQFAVDSAIDAIKDFVNVVKDEKIDLDPEQEEAFHERLKELAANILSRWHDRVDKDVEDYPFQEEDMKPVSEKYKARYATGNYNAKAYGTTLLAVCATEEYWFGLQIGDGKCVAFSEDGCSSEPIPWDAACQSNITTSLCDSDALEEFRYFCGKELPLAVFIGSDGIDDSYAGEKELYALYHSIMTIFAEQGTDLGRDEVKEFLPRISKNGSGDDVSIAGLIRANINPIRLRFFKAQGEYETLQREVEKLENDTAVAKDRVAYIDDALRKAKKTVEDAQEKFNRAQRAWENSAAELAEKRKLRDQAEIEFKKLSDEMNSKLDSTRDILAAEEESSNANEAEAHDVQDSLAAGEESVSPEAADDDNTTIQQDKSICNEDGAMTPRTDESTSNEEPEQEEKNTVAEQEQPEERA